MTYKNSPCDSCPFCIDGGLDFGEQNNALKRQLGESNRQIEIYAKKVRNLEAELEEDGGLG